MAPTFVPTSLLSSSVRDDTGTSRDQRGLGQLVAGLKEVAPQRARADPQHDVVHLDTEGVLDGADVVERDGVVGEAAVGGAARR